MVGLCVEWSLVTSMEILHQFKWRMVVILSACFSVKPVWSFSAPPGSLTWNDTGQFHPCRRECREDQPAEVCFYTFELEHYYVLSRACYDCPRVPEDCLRPDCVAGDGTRRSIITVNRQMPGPAIEVCLHDTIVVDVVNMLGHESTAIHWHGLHQRNYQYMDGVPWITQCPQSGNSVFRYRFPASQPGTYFWHSHMGFQRSDGAYGALIVRQPVSSDPHGGAYDTDLSEHHVLVTDWIRDLTIEKFNYHYHSVGPNKPETVLINGRGRLSGQHRNQSGTPLADFTVDQGKRHRFRFVCNGISNCPLAVSVDGHKLTVISSDGQDLQPVTADSLVLYAGERYDIVLTADQPKGVYWMRVQGLMDCGSSFTSAHQVAVVRYRGVTTPVPDSEVTYENSGRVGKQISPFNVAKLRETTVPVSALKSLSPKPDATSKQKADQVFYLDYDFSRVENPHFHHPQHYSIFNVPPALRMLTPQIHNITMKMPMAPPLSQPETPLNKCNRSTVGNCSRKMCECTHVLDIALGNVVELVIIDRGFVFNANHPMHLHGYSFRVVSMEKLGKQVTREQVIERDRLGRIPRNLVDGPLKDTVTVPDGGYTIVRFHADNPGWWLFHCHINFHSETGMALVFHVGQPGDLPPVPRGFPQCGSFQPPEDPSPPKKYVMSSNGGYSMSTPLIVTLLIHIALAFRSVIPVL